MKNVIEILKGLGVEVPEDKIDSLNKEVAENYKTVAEFDKKVKKLESERDDLQERAENAEKTLKDFEGKDFDSITRDRDAWKVKYDSLIKEQTEKAEKEELDNAIAEAIKQAKGRDAKAIIAHLDLEAIKSSKNRDTDIANAIKQLSESEETQFLFHTDPEQNRAKLTTVQKKTVETNGNVTREGILAMKDRVARVNAIAQHRELFPEFDK